MLNGIDPIIIFNFKKIPPGLDAVTKIPVVSDIVSVIDLPAIPIYLSEKITGMYIDSEDKNVDVATTTEGSIDGTTTQTNQHPITSTITVNLIASRNSVGIALLSALVDLIFPKLTSKEYSVTYLHGAVTVFAGLLHSFSINQNSNNDLYTIGLGLIKVPPEISKVPQVSKSTGTLPLTAPTI